MSPRVPKLREAIGTWDVTTIYHLAAILSAAGERNPQTAWDVNMRGLQNILELSREMGVKRVYLAQLHRRLRSRDPPGQDPPGCPAGTHDHVRHNEGRGRAPLQLLLPALRHRRPVDKIPGIISNKVLPHGGTTDYAVEMFYQAILKKRYTCFVRADTVLPMMYMPDAIRATLMLMDAGPKSVTCHMGHNLAALSFSAGELADEIKKHIPDFVCEFVPDYRQKIADSWPESVDDSVARKDWGWKPKYNLAAMTKDMISELGARANQGVLAA